MSQESYISRCFEDYSSSFEDTDRFEIDSEFSISHSNGDKNKTLEERIKIKKAIEKLMEEKRIKEETDFL